MEEPVDEQIRELKRGAQIVWVLPGNGPCPKTMKLGQVKAMVLDEADEMLSMGSLKTLNGFWNKLQRIGKLLFFRPPCPNPFENWQTSTSMNR